MIKEKRAEYLGRHPGSEPDEPDDFPESASLCKKCMTRAMILMDNCLTCLNCGESKCS